MDKQTELEAAVLRKLIKHFQDNTDVQNIDLMNLAGFCRNCLSKWMVSEGKEMGLDVDIDVAREQVYGMPYQDWKDKFQKPATPEQLAEFNKSK